MKMKLIERVLIGLAVLAVLLIVSGCSTARWTFRKSRTPQAATHTGKGGESRSVEITSGGAYEVIRLPDGAYLVRPVADSTRKDGEHQ